MAVKGVGLPFIGRTRLGVGRAGALKSVEEGGIEVSFARIDISGLYEANILELEADDVTMVSSFLRVDCVKFSEAGVL